MQIVAFVRLTLKRVREIQVQVDVIGEAQDGMVQACRRLFAVAQAINRTDRKPR